MVYTFDQLVDRFLMKNRGFWNRTLVLATAGNYGHVELWNPATSATNLLVYRLWIATVANRHPTIRSTTSLIAGTTVTPNSSVFGSAAVSKANVRSILNAAVQGTQIATITTAAYIPAMIETRWIIKPGRGIIIAGAAQNANFNAGFSWAEVPLALFNE